jgi:hypothetical protein
MYINKPRIHFNIYDLMVLKSGNPYILNGRREDYNPKQNTKRLIFCRKGHFYIYTDPMGNIYRIAMSSMKRHWGTNGSGNKGDILVVAHQELLMKHTPTPQGMLMTLEHQIIGEESIRYTYELDKVGCIVRYLDCDGNYWDKELGICNPYGEPKDRIQDVLLKMNDMHNKSIAHNKYLVPTSETPTMEPAQVEKLFHGCYIVEEPKGVLPREQSNGDITNTFMPPRISQQLLGRVNHLIELNELNHE